MEPRADPPSEPGASKPGEPAGTPVDKTLRATYVFVGGAGAAITALTAALGGGRAALGAAIGALLATLNLWVFAQVVRAFLERRETSAPWAVVAALKLVLLLGAVFLIVRTGYVSPAALGIGYGALPVGIVLAGLFGPRPPP